MAHRGSLERHAKIPRIPSAERLPMEVVVVSPREIRVFKQEHVTLVCGTAAATFDVECGGAKSRVDRSTCFLAPAKKPLRLRKDVASARVVLLELSDVLASVVCSLYARLGTTQKQWNVWIARPTLLPRTVWIHEVVHRLVFERYVLGESNNTATQFLEEELLKEIYFLFRDRDQGTERAANTHRHSPPVQAALDFIEAHLFDEVDVSKLHKAAGTSESSLLRAFRKELDSQPGAYWRARKLDEAMVLLRNGTRVAEVAFAVGYDNPTSFGFAFRRRFGAPPKDFRSSLAKRPAP